MRSVSEICMFIRFYFLFLQEMKLFQYVFICFVNCYFHFRKLSVSEMNICVVIMKWFYRSSDVRRNAIVLFCFHLGFYCYFHFRKRSVSEMNVCVVIMKWFYPSSDVRRNAIVLFCFHLVFIAIFFSESVRF